MSRNIIRNILFLLIVTKLVSATDLKQVFINDGILVPSQQEFQRLITIINQDPQIIEYLSYDENFRIAFSNYFYYQNINSFENLSLRLQNDEKKLLDMLKATKRIYS